MSTVIKLKQIVRAVIVRGINLVMATPVLAGLARAAARRMPALKWRLVQMYFGVQPLVTQQLHGLRLDRATSAVCRSLFNQIEDERRREGAASSLRARR